MPSDVFRKCWLNWFFCLAAGLAQATAADSAQDQGQQNFHKMKYGLFVHYVWGGTAYPATVNPDGSIPSGLDDLADRFDAGRFAEDLASMHVEYVIFTAWHANMNCLWPSPAMKKWMPAHASRRDVLRDMITAVKARGIRVLLYTHPTDGHDLTPAEQAATGWGPAFDRARWNDFINEVYADLLSRYGNDIEGLYLDEHGGRNADFIDYERLRNTIKDVNPGLLMLQNDYGTFYNADLGDQEIFAFNTTDGNTWPALSSPSAVLLSRNWWASGAGNAYAPRYSPESVFRYTVLKAGVIASAGGPAWAAGNYPGGGWETGVLETMRTVTKYLRPIARSITNTFASTSYVTRSGAALQDLDWGVATRSTDDRCEYLHVLTPPSGKTLRLSPPADGKQFTSARLLANEHPVALVQTPDGISLTLDNADHWEPLDTVIELQVGGKSTPASVRPASDREKTPHPEKVARQSTTNSPGPAGPTPGMSRWFDASMLKLTNSAPVTLWPDLSGNEAHATCAEGANPPPTFVADDGTGRGSGAVHFGPGHGLNPALNSQALTFRADTKIRTVFSVFKGAGFLLTDYGASHFHRPDDTNAAAPLWTRELTSPHILGGTTRVNGQPVDGISYATPTNWNNGFNLVVVLATNIVTASGFNKDRYCHAGDQCQAEVILYDFPLNDEQQRQTEDYLKAKWFGTGLPAAGHN